MIWLVALTMFLLLVGCVALALSGVGELSSAHKRVAKMNHRSQRTWVVKNKGWSDLPSPSGETVLGTEIRREGLGVGG